MTASALPVVGQAIDPAEAPVAHADAGIERGAISARRAKVRLGVRPVHLIVATLLASVLGQLGRVPLLWAQGKDAPILVHELPLVAALAATAVACMRARALRLDGVCLAALAFAFIGGLSALLAVDTFRLSGYELTVSLAYLARWLAYLGIYVVVLNTARVEDARALWTAVERGVLTFTAFGIVQSVFLPGFAQKVFPEGGDSMPWDWQGYRLVSTILDPNYAGGLILLPLLVMLARLASGDRVPLWRPLVLFAGLVLTFSRSSMLGLFVGSGVIVAARGVRPVLIKFAGLVLLAGLPAVPVLARLGSEYNKFTVRDGSALQRTVMWLRALTVLGDYPVLGVGFNTYGFVQRRYGWDIVGRDGFAVDGGLLFIAVMTGVVGLIAYLVMLGLMWRRARGLWRDPGATPLARGVALGVAAATLAIVVHSCFVNSLLLPFIMAPLWALWGVVFLLARHREGDRRALAVARRAWTLVQGGAAVAARGAA